MAIRDAFLAVSAPVSADGAGASPLLQLINDLSYAVAQLAAAQKVNASLIEQIRQLPDFDGAPQ